MQEIFYDYSFMRGSRTFLSEGVQLWRFLFFFSWWGEGDPNTTIRRAIIGPPAKRHLNGVSLACRQWLNIECWLKRFVIFRGSGPVLLRNPIFFIFQGGGGGLDPLSPPPPLDQHLSFFLSVFGLVSFCGFSLKDAASCSQDALRPEFFYQLIYRIFFQI